MIDAQANFYLPRYDKRGMHRYRHVEMKNCKAYFLQLVLLFLAIINHQSSNIISSFLILYNELQTH